MLLSESQVKRFWREWADACRAQGWTTEKGVTSKQVDAHRKSLLKRAGFESLKQVDRSAGFNRVLGELGILSSRLKPTVERDNPQIDAERRKRWVIQNRLLPCLGVYVDNPDRYLASILQDKFAWKPTGNYGVPMTLDDLADDPVIVTGSAGQLIERPSQLDQVIMTLESRIQNRRKESGDSVHDMRMKAEISCDCRICTKPAPISLQEATGTPDAPEAETTPF